MARRVWVRSRRVKGGGYWRRVSKGTIAAYRTRNRPMSRGGISGGLRTPGGTSGQRRASAARHMRNYSETLDRVPQNRTPKARRRRAQARAGFAKQGYLGRNTTLTRRLDRHLASGRTSTYGFSKKEQARMRRATKSARASGPRRRKR